MGQVAAGGIPAAEQAPGIHTVEVEAEAAEETAEEDITCHIEVVHWVVVAGGLC